MLPRMRRINSSGTLWQESAVRAMRVFNSLFGGVDPSTGKLKGGGTLSQFLDPSKLNVDRPTGVYGLQYQNARGQLAKEAQAQRGALSRTMANRGFGSSMSGMEASTLMRQGVDVAGQRGQLFAQGAQASYQDALQNFWTATGMENDAMNASRGAAVTSSGNAGQIAANLYGTAGQAHMSQSPVGAAIGAAGSIAGGAIACPVVGSKITLVDGSKKAVEELTPDDFVLGMSGESNPVLERPVIRKKPAVQCDFRFHSARVSIEHTFPKIGGGYKFARNIKDVMVPTDNGDEMGVAVSDLGEMDVAQLFIGGDHSYFVDGVGSLV
jgi:hypothetical protein